MGLFDKITKLAEKAADAVVKTSDKINETYQKEGFDGIINKTADSITNAGKKTQDYINTLGEKNKQIMDSMPDKDLEGTLAKATAVVINTTQTLVKDAAKVTVGTVESVSKNIEKIVSEDTSSKESTVQATPATDTSTKKTKSDVKELFLNEGQIAELDCMPISLFVQHLGAESNVDGQRDKFKLDGFNFITKDQKWYDFNRQKGGVGALSFMNHYIRVNNGLLDNIHPEVQKEIRNSTFAILSEILEMPQYRESLSVWIKEQNTQPKTVTPQVENAAEELLDDSESPVVTKPKRTRKPVAQKTEVENVETTPVKKPARKTTKKLIVEPETPKAPAKRTSKKVVKDAVSETFTEETPAKKTSKLKV